MTNEKAVELVISAFDAWEYQYYTGDDWSEEHEAKDMAIKALEQESILDKIKAEIEELDGILAISEHLMYSNKYVGLSDVVQIIDKYKRK